MSRAQQADYVQRPDDPILRAEQLCVGQSDAITNRWAGARIRTVRTADGLLGNECEATAATKVIDKVPMCECDVLYSGDLFAVS